MDEKLITKIQEDLVEDNYFDKIDKLVQLYRDFKIDDEELFYLLKSINCPVNDEFPSYPIYKKREFYQNKIIYLYFEDGKFKSRIKRVFNKEYYNELISKCKEDESYFGILKEYISALDNVALSFLTMQRFKLKEIVIKENKTKFIDNFIKSKSKKGIKISTLFDLFIRILEEPEPKDVLLRDKLNNTKKVLFDYLKNNIGFTFDPGKFVFQKLATDCEIILSKLPLKVANTIKIKFLIYDKQYLNENEYNNSLKTGKTLINKFFKDTEKNELVNAARKKLVKYYKTHKDILDGFNDNGYRALLYAILKED